MQREAEAGLDFARQIPVRSRHLTSSACSSGLIRTLRGLTPEFGSFDDAHFDELRSSNIWPEDPSLSLAAFLYWLRKLQARFFAGDYASAVDASSKAQRLCFGRRRHVLEAADYEFYGALSDCASAMPHLRMRTSSTRLWQPTIASSRSGRENCPENFEDRAALVGAEIARIEGRDAEAMRLYERAIRSARANGFLHNEALAYELAARFYSARGFEKIARLYLRKARYGYLRWGADGKVRQLDQQYPQLRQEKPVTGSTSIDRCTCRTPGSGHCDQSLASRLGRDGYGKTDRQTHARGHRARRRRARSVDCSAR